MTGYEIKPTGWLSINISEIWKFRELFFFMAWRDIKVKYKQTFLGLTWVILQPFILMVIFSFIWQNVLKIDSTEIPYPLFAYSGIIVWGLFSACISGAGESMITNANIIKKVYFPRIIIPTSTVLVSFFDFLMTFIVYILLILYYNLHIDVFRFMGLITLSIIITILSAFGIALIIASANLKYRDFRYLIPFFLQAFFFISPVIFPFSLFNSEKLRFILSLNPLAGAIKLSRSALTDAQIQWPIIFYGSIISVMLFIAGLIFFRKVESKYADLL